MVLKKVGLTGCTGMIGQYVLKELDNRNIKCVLTSRKKPENISKESIWVNWNLEEWKNIDELKAVFSGIDALIHVGAAVPTKNADISNREILDINVKSCLNLGELALALGIPMVFISGATVYANPNTKNIKETDKLSSGECFGGFYGYSKLLAEQVLKWLKQQGLKLIVLRPSSVYGVGLNPEKIITSIIIKTLKNQVIELKPPYNSKINLIHASDVAIAILDALQKEAFGIYNIAGETAYSITEIAQTCIKILGRGSIKTNSTDEDEEPTVRFDLNFDKAKKDFCYSPKTNLTGGLREMILNIGEKY